VFAEWAYGFCWLFDGGGEFFFNTNFLPFLGQNRSSKGGKATAIGRKIAHT
jgi:hypothetical protein